MHYRNDLRPTPDPLPILADHPEFVEPLREDDRFEAPPLVEDSGGTLRVRAWRYWYNAEGIVEMENLLDPAATAIVVVHPWGIDDGHGLRSPRPAGVAFFCTPEKNAIGLRHTAEVIDPFLKSLRDHVALVGYSLPGTEDPVRTRLYASVNTRAEDLRPAEGERELKAVLGEHPFRGEPLAAELALDPKRPVCSYFGQSPSTDAGPRYNGAGYWDLPMPVARQIDVAPDDVVFYDAEGYPKVRDYLRSVGVRHVLLAGYATDMCFARTTCGYENLCKDFNLFLVGDASLATFPASTTPRFATQVALVNASLTQLVTQVSWVRLEGSGGR